MIIVYLIFSPWLLRAIQLVMERAVSHEMKYMGDVNMITQSDHFTKLGEYNHRFLFINESYCFAGAMIIERMMCC